MACIHNATSFGHLQRRIQGARIRNCESDEFRPNKVRVIADEGDMVAIKIQNMEVRKE
jgi:hypothetical protein